MESLTTVEVVKEASLVRQHLSVDSVVYLSKTLFAKIGLLETCYMFGQDHPSITKHTLQELYMKVLQTYIAQSIEVKVRAEAEFQLQQWYEGRFDFDSCSLTNFKFLLTRLVNDKEDNGRILRAYLKSHRKKSMVDAFENFADVRGTDDCIGLFDKRQQLVIDIIRSIDDRIDALPSIRQKHNDFFTLNRL
ncbi:ORF138 [Betabaculovirus altermyunipunctae]|uniref:ORF138 n=1 Tax=Betabaculovirus altermyunipunctae TaxID=3051996 RepID=A0A1S5YE76_9BBAC|nr:ORF138 [Betabaculovirus altermyunipunctae]AQQ80405.1 ORF138 [Betabaculovirus altermyunipunctae]